MSDRDIQLATPGDVLAALALLTRLPLPGKIIDRGAASIWAYPVAGLVVGLIAAAVALVADVLDLPAEMIAGFALFATILVTGALHEDGLADSADGLWGASTRESRLEIMKDSRIGAYGVIALILALGLKWVALTNIATTGNIASALIIVAVLSRTPMVALMHALPNARASGLSAHVGRPTKATIGVSMILPLAIGGLLMGSQIISLGICLIVLTIFIAVVAMRKINGQSGDILGASQQLSEITILTLLTL